MAKRLLETGCPECGQKDQFDVVRTERTWQRAWLDEEGCIEHGGAEYIKITSEDHVLCPFCHFSA
jgi:hypothetical protein